VETGLAMRTRASKEATTLFIPVGVANRDRV
jgi:hypothetical protein